MKMPDKIYVHFQKDDGYVGECIDGELEPSEGYETEYHHSRIVEALKAENKELKAKLEKAKWQPIESAPRDGKSILVTDGYDVCDAYFRGGDWWQYQCGDDWYSTSINPTHWMPLPDAPEQR